MTRLSQIGEWETIRRVQKILGSPKIPAPHKLLVGPGDDTAVVNFTTPSRLAFTTDTLVEGTHFRLDWMRRHFSEKEVWQGLGWKAMAVNLSDLAAMGGARPILALLTFGGRGDISVDTVENVARGISKLTRNLGFSVVGGDTIRSDKTIISITLVGEIVTHNPVLRSGAKKGDLLGCTGPLGLSMAGMELLQRESILSSKEAKFLANCHIRPVPKLKEGEILGNVDIFSTSMLDTSDDLRTSLEILFRQSAVGIECDLSQTLIHPALSWFCKKNGALPYDYILNGGEDYQLLFTVPASNAEKVLKKIPGAYIFGKITDKKNGIRLLDNGKAMRIKNERFKHF